MIERIIFNLNDGTRTIRRATWTWTDNHPGRLGNLAPPDGLCLDNVEYDPPPAWVDPTREH